MSVNVFLSIASVFIILAKVSISLAKEGQVLSEYFSELMIGFELLENLTNTFYHFPKAKSYVGPLICSFFRDPK